MNNDYINDNDYIMDDPYIGSCSHANLLDKHGALAYVLHGLLAHEARSWDLEALDMEAERAMRFARSSKEDGMHQQAARQYCYAAYFYSMVAVHPERLVRFPIRSMMETILFEVGSYGSAEEQFDAMCIRGRAMWEDLHDMPL